MTRHVSFAVRFERVVQRVDKSRHAAYRLDLLVVENPDRAVAQGLLLDDLICIARTIIISRAITPAPMQIPGGKGSENRPTSVYPVSCSLFLTHRDKDSIRRSMLIFLSRGHPAHQL